MNVRELIVELEKQDPELRVMVGIGCSCYGTGTASEVYVTKDPNTGYKGEEDIVYISE